MAVSPAARAVEVLNKSAANLRAAHQKAVIAAAQEAKATILGELRKTVPSGRLRNVGRSGARVGVGYEIKGLGDSTTALVRGRGAWGLIERNIKPHTIRPNRRRGKKALRLPDGGIRRSVHHPGVRRPSGGPFERGFKAAQPRIYKILGESYRKAVRSAWS